MDISNLVCTKNLVCTNDISILEYMIKDILIKFKIFRLYKKSNL